MILKIFCNKRRSIDFYYTRVNNEISIGEAEKILKISRKNHWTSVTCRLLKIIAYKFYDGKKFALSYNYFLSYINLNENIYNIPESADVFIKMAICQNHLNEISESIIYLKKAEIIADYYNNKEELKKVYYNLAIAYGKSDCYDLSLQCIKKSREIDCDINNASYEVYLQSCEANCYVKLNQYNKAINIYKELLSDKEIDETTAFLYNNMAMIYIEMGDYVKAKTYNDKSYNLRKNSDSVNETMKTRAYLYESQHMYVKAIEILEGIVNNDIGYDYSVKIESYKKLIELYNKTSRVDLQRKTFNDMCRYINSEKGILRRLLSYKVIINVVISNLKIMMWQNIELPM